MTRVTKSYDERKTQILDTAQQLFYQKGYNNISVAAIIDAIGIAKGTFYHYFKTKSDLLDQIIDRQAQMIDQLIERVLDEPEKDALEELNNIYSAINQYKSKNKDVMLMIVRVLYSDANLEMRIRLLKKRVDIVAPQLGKVIRRGIREGVFNTPDDAHPNNVALLMLNMGAYLGEEFARMTIENKLDQQHKKIFFKLCRLYEKSLERILGLEKGGIKIFNRKNLAVYFE